MAQVLEFLSDNFTIILAVAGALWLGMSPFRRAILWETITHPSRRSRIEMDEGGHIRVQIE